MLNLRKKAQTSLNWIKSRGVTRGGVLLYHRVENPTRDPFNLCVTPDHFDEHMSVLSSIGSVTSLDALVVSQKSGSLIPGSLAVTFDDGYLDVFENALPILEKYEIPATVFVTTGNLGNSFWWDRLENLVFSSGASHETYNHLYAKFSIADNKEREELFEETRATFGRPPIQEASRCANVEELRKAAQHPLITIGAHTVSHTRLADLDYEEQLEEIENSRNTLGEILDTDIQYFSYPFGIRDRDFDDETVRAVSRSGIDSAFAADRNVVTGSTDPFSIPRIWVPNQDGKSFQRQIQFWLGSAPSRNKPLYS